MKRILILSLLIFSSVTWAENESYELNVEMTMDGKPIAIPPIRTIAGEKTSIIQKTGDQESFLEVVATEGKGQIKEKKAVLMKFVIGIIQDGQRKIISQPQLMALENSRAEINISGSQSLNLNVTAKKVPGYFR